MRSCPSCSAPAPAQARFCPSCGGALESTSRMATAVAPPPPSATPAPASVAFAPGEIVEARYRIVGLLGRGGMGEVYRADDLKLGQAVALKFLPRALENDASARERFHAEVRLTRQVSHPHVCRVYDIGEVEGRPFLSMEYVDGEDLATLLRRIGRLPPAKAVEIARQLCAGLAAAHEKGVLHRDLKPANVMVDGHGRARITDFGLAVAGDEAHGFAGTPAYMAPERLAGGPATVRSDLYELGLVLYELFTGKHAFAEQRPASGPLTHPSMHTSDMDPAAERAILRCLEPEPDRRPRSAAELAHALPGGDPLAAAVAAGETPSPEMVAAAGGEGVLPRARAWTLLLGLLTVVGIVVALVPASSDLGIAPMDAGPEAIEHRARELAKRFGGAQPVADSAVWMERNYPLIRWLADHLPSTDWRRRLATLGPPALLHLRLSPEPLVAANIGALVGDGDPPQDVPGMVSVVVTASGRLGQLQVVPPRRDVPLTPAATAPPWDTLFKEAMLDPARFTEVTPTWRPPVPYDVRREWQGTVAELPELPLRLSIATLGDRAVYMSLLGPWNEPSAVNPLTTGIGPRVRAVTLGVMIVALVSVLPFFTRRNLRLGRADRRGAARVAWTIAMLALLAWLGLSHFPPSGTLVPVLGGALAIAAAAGLFAWGTYLALEPYLRRQTPELLIGWARVLEGRFTDPRVGSDLLGGALLGATGAAAVHFVNGLPTWLSFPAQTTMPHLASLALGRLSATGALCQLPATAVIRALTFTCVAFLLRLVLKRPALVFAAIWLLGAALAWGAENMALEAPGSIIVGLTLAIAVTRLGLLATVAWVAVGLLLQNFPLVFTSPWYTPYALLVLGLVVGTGIWAFRVSLGGQPAFGGSLDA